MLDRFRIPAAVGLFAGLAVLVLGIGGDAAAQQQTPQLPAAVSEWLERDQLQRWAQMIQTGEELFSEGSCANCHGDGGSGGRFGPDLTDAEWVQSDGDLEGIRQVIFWGVRRPDFADPDRRFEMNPQGGMDLEWDEIAAMAAYVWSLNNGTFLPQR